MTEGSPEEWIFVPPKKFATRNRKDNRRTSKRDDRQLEKVKQFHKTLNSKPDDSVHKNTHAHKQLLIATIEKCVNEIKCFGRLHVEGGQQTNHHLFDLQTLVNSIQDAANRGKCERDVNEIICYGIGNFEGARDDRYNAPLIQLACVLALRDAFARRVIDSRGHINSNELNSIITTCQNESESNQNDQDEVTEDGSSPSQRQQEPVSIVYYEPFIKTIEREILAHFHVKVLDSNEQGKRRIKRNTREDSSNFESSTLFYMPHCPMRLYSNVLWANWREDLILNGSIIIFGNSFRAYDERIISSEKKEGDRTNAIFSLLPFSCEVEILTKYSHRNRSSSSSIDTLLCGQDIEMAFNDCVILSFHKDDEAIPFPSQPEEYIVSKDSDGELV
jgi:hypothetical protein